MPSSENFPKFFYFDLGKVLVDFDHAKGFSQIAGLFKAEAKNVGEFFINSGLAMKYETGLVSSEELHAAFCKNFKLNLAIEDLMHAASDIFTLKTDTIKVAEDLKNAGYRLGILSNTSIAHWNYCTKNYPFLKIFGTCILSFEVKAMKPDARIYAAALKQCGVPAENVFFTDDLAENIAGAKKHGINAVQFTDAVALRKEIRRLIGEF
jgi:glucose-1-phosphatase